MLKVDPVLLATARASHRFTQGLVLWGLALASAGLLAGAFAFEHIGGLAPCPLCLLQRWAHAAALVLALIGAAGPALGLVGADWRPVCLVTCAFALLAGVLYAGTHVGVEEGWWSAPTGCASGGPLGGLTIESIATAFEGPRVVPCDAKPWTLFGISMAGYNFLLSMGLAAIALLGLTRPEGKA
ncbi:MAG: disulfide bond formation protein B [Alphaproteobacteria bacterium]|nr:disulfide bond formation protein B [Alphaproteobacteria bacterium]